MYTRSTLPNIDYLNMLQNNIARMSNYSSSIKNWSITTTVALLTLHITITGLTSPTEKELQLLLISMVAIITFWWLDAFFFYTEKKYRKIYELIIGGNWDTSNDFCLKPDLAIEIENPNQTRFAKACCKLKLRFKAIVSTAVFPMYILQLSFVVLFNLNIL
ncbi:hypothetical protein AB6C54_18610 [Vibrio splendidus]